MEKVVLPCKKLSSTAKLPTRAHEDDAAWDLYADCPNNLYIQPGATVIVPTNVAIVPPKGWCCDIRGRSGMNSKGRLVALGLVDSNYSGAWGVVLFNSTDTAVMVAHHDRIAQFKVNKVYASELQEVESFDLPDGSRGAYGFGSSGR